MRLLILLNTLKKLILLHILILLLIDGCFLFLESQNRGAQIRIFSWFNGFKIYLVGE